MLRQTFKVVTAIDIQQFWEGVWKQSALRIYLCVLGLIVLGLVTALLIIHVLGHEKGIMIVLTIVFLLLLHMFERR